MEKPEAEMCPRCKKGRLSCPDLSGRGTAKCDRPPCKFVLFGRQPKFARPS
jgi:hypothetical protein